MDKFDAFLANYPSKKFPRGSTIIEQGDRPEHAYVVRSGFVKVFNITAAGEERPVLFDLTYEVFPIGWVFGKIDHSYFFYEAFTDTELYMVPREDYIAYLKQNPDMMYKALDYYVERHISHQLRMHALEQSRACDKVLYTLEFLCRRFGIAGDNDTIELKLPLTQQDFANFIGLTRETTAIELKNLQRQGVVTYKAQAFTVNGKKLTALLEER